MEFLSERQVLRKIGVCRSTLWRYQKNGVFPKRRRIGPRRVGWLDSDVEAWMKSRGFVEIGSEPEAAEK